MTPAEHHLRVIQATERALDIHSRHVDHLAAHLEHEEEEDERDLADVIPLNPTAYTDWYGTDESYA